MRATAIRDCIAPDRHPRAPRIALPKGAVDAHVHVFENRYALTPERDYNPPKSTVDDLKSLHAVLGFERVVFTQPSPYGIDNAAMLDGMAALNDETPDRARAIVAAAPDITEDEIASLDAAGARGVRLNADNGGGMAIGFADIPSLEAKLAPFGWHIEFLIPGAAMVELLPVFRGIRVPISFAHFAFQPAAAGVGAPGFQALLALVREGNTYVKISGANRVSATDLPPYDDVRPMAEALVEANVDRLLWGTDWPHPNKYDVNPNDGDLVDALAQWVPDAALRQKILVDTPVAFYRF